MQTVTITCPHCSLSRELPAEKVPDRPVRVTCNRCRGSFEFSKPVTPPSPPPPHPGTPPSPAPEPAPEPPPASGEKPPVPPGKPPLKKPLWVPPASLPRLAEVGELFGEAWEAYRSRGLLLLGLLLFALVFAALPMAIVVGGAAWAGKNNIVIDGAPLMLLVALAAVASGIALFRGMSALIAAACDHGLDFREALARGKTTWIALLWASVLYGFIVTGATLLFLIPGILTGVWFFASPYLAVEGSARGMEALLKSRALVRGRFWPVLFRLFLVWLLSTLLGMVPFAGPILALLMTPYTILFQIALLRSLEASSGNLAYSATTGDKARWLLLGLAGYVLIPLIVVTVAGVSFFGSLMPLLKSGGAPQGRQIITIPPPSGQLPIGLPKDFGATGAPSLPADSIPPPAGGPGSAPAGSSLRATDLSIFIYAVNAPGTIRVNGQEFKTIKSEPNMQYNINTFGEHFRTGDNTIEFDVTPSRGVSRSLSPEIHMKVSRSGSVLGEWRLSDRDGWPRSVTLNIAEGKAP